MLKKSLVTIGLTVGITLPLLTNASLEPGQYQALRNQAELVLEGRVLAADFSESANQCEVQVTIDNVRRNKTEVDYSGQRSVFFRTLCSDDATLADSLGRTVADFETDELLRVYLNSGEINLIAVEDGIVHLNYPEKELADPEDVRELINQEQSPFTDLDSNNAAYQAIYALWLQKIIHGYSDGTFGPEQEINRAELLKMLIESDPQFTRSQKDLIVTESEFTDVDVTSWYAPYIVLARQKGWVEGYEVVSEETGEMFREFKPAQSVKRAEAIKMILEARGVQAEELPQISFFSDVDLYKWYADYVLLAEEKNLLPDSSDLFYPQETAKRAWVSQILFKIYANSLPEVSTPIDNSVDPEPAEEEVILPEGGSISVSVEEYSFIDFGNMDSSSTAIASASGTYIVWNYRDDRQTNIYVSDQEGTVIRELFSGAKEDSYIPWKFSNDQKRLFVYQETTGLGGYYLFQYFAQNLMEIDLETGEILYQIDFVTNQNNWGKFLNFSPDQKYFAYFYNEGLNSFTPYKTWLKVENWSNHSVRSFDLPFYSRDGQQFGAGFFSPDNKKLAYMISSGDGSDNDIFSVIVVDLENAESVKLVESDPEWIGTWMLAGWKDNETILISKDAYEEVLEDEILEISIY